MQEKIMYNVKKQNKTMTGILTAKIDDKLCQTCRTHAGKTTWHIITVTLGWWVPEVLNITQMFPLYILTFGVRISGDLMELAKLYNKYEKNAIQH